MELLCTWTLVTMGLLKPYKKIFDVSLLEITQTKLIHLLNKFVLYQMNLFYHNIE
jgi:hypothetical protein